MLLRRGIPPEPLSPPVFGPVEMDYRGGRRLQSVITNTSMEYGDLVKQLEEDEIPLLKSVQAIYDEDDRQEDIELYERARQEMVWSTLPEAEANF